MIPRKIGIFVFPGFQILDAAGPLAAFEISGRDAGGAYRVSTLAIEAGPVLSTSGATLGAGKLDPAERYDTLIVMGGTGSIAFAADPEALHLIRAAAANARRVASVCSGAFVLAAAGLLDGKRATTHWLRSADFARRFPKVRLEPDRIYVRDGAVWTSAGITAGIDLALAMIAEDLGEESARRTAEQLVVYRRRPGGQSQFSTLLDIERPSGRFAALTGWMRERLHEPLNVERLASKAAMSPRNFARAFTAETGVTPARAVEHLRVEAARASIEASAEPIDAIARSAGFNDPERMRRAFLRAFGQPPQALRRAARAA
jgi:transcriptional regulator GlxA family with amidase domain